MNYWGEFYDTEKKLYTVNISTELNGGDLELTLAGNPFIVTIKDDDNLYLPVKYSTATVGIITPNYNFDIYSAKAQGTKVELVSNSGIEWVGYITPNLYDMGFVEDREAIELECIDALSTLQYFKYSSTNKLVVSFLYIIRKILEKCDAYKYFYFPYSTQIDSVGSRATVLERLFISEANFFDKKEDDETDEDVAWTMLEVLEQISQYLGLTAVAIGDSVYFLDYDGIKLADGNYYLYSVYSDDEPITTNSKLIKTIGVEDYSGSDNRISLDSTYNKVTVSADLYTYEDVIPDVFESLLNITKDADSKLTNSTNASVGIWGEVIEDSGERMLVMVDRVYIPLTNKYGDFNAVFIKYYSRPNYRLFKYDSLGNDITDKVTELNYTDTKTMYGTTIAQFDVQKMENTTAIDEYDFVELFLNLSDKDKRVKALDLLLSDNDITKASFSNYIVMLNPENNHISNSDILKYPYFQTELNNNVALFGGKNAYLIISGDIIYHSISIDPYPIPEGLVDISEGRRYILKGLEYFVAKLLWGNLFWNGEEWTDKDTTFKLPYLKSSTTDKERRADATMFKSMPIRNTVSWRFGVTDSGYLIPTPNNSLMTDSVVFTMYKPYNPTFDKDGLVYKFNCVFIKDFTIKAVMGNPTFNTNQDDDTVYINTVDEDSITEMEEVKFKICTWDNKKPNYSAVAYSDNGSLKYLDKTYNRFCHTGELSLMGADGLRLEEHLIYKLVNQYSSPAIKLNLCLRNDIQLYGSYKSSQFSDKVFVVSGLEVDYKNNASVVTLIEKK